ncbi:glycosyltransferase family 4 protein [Paludisphaera mucosa]|uniref:Glycosyltransferase family 4 protein n=1 Tax=Paludisphaera mucosa TaxID=3030827 RepID=A0ABT6FBZ1_9BACT|nr:glycosyltransferase family 4 protein [Paludisphaera mucosa]MDG3005100.1 glycosyltransferase family 4 protein [Paludisphaera mucosa]
MNRTSEVRKIAFVGDYLPRKCGIATYTHDLCTSTATQFPSADCFVVPVNDLPEGYDYPPEVRFEIEEQELDSYLRAADFLNFSNADVVCLQHEYGIFGGPAGSHILRLLRNLRMPIVTTLHTVLKEPNEDQRRVMDEILELSARVIVMSERARTFLREVWNAPEAKIDLIAHGIPDMPFVDSAFYKDQFSVEGKHVALTFGLLAPNKGIEYMLEAMPAILEEFPNFVYIVLGATHPNLVREQGERYRISLERLARKLGIRENVSFYNRFVDLPELIEFIGVADIYVTPYLNPAQITSGTLAYAFGCGKAVVSTPYWHAEELLADGRGVLVPFADSGALATAIRDLLRDESRRHAMRKRGYLMGREMIWSRVAHQFVESFQHARRSRLDVLPIKPLAVRTLAEQPLDLPGWRLDHLVRMSDSAGMFQHATFTIPNFAEGYCTDDNARALLLTVMLEQLGQGSLQTARLASTYAAFLNYAFDPARGQFRNFMSFDRRWLEDVGSDDSQGRAIWVLGACVRRSQRHDLQFWASHLFDQALPGLLETSSPRAWAFGLLGVCHYLQRLAGARPASQARDLLAQKLLQLYEAVATDEWRWFEDRLTYDNARLSQGLIAAARNGGPPEALQAGLDSLSWLVEHHKAPSGCFRPIGCNGFYVRNGIRAQFDQQPVEAQAMVSACLEAYRATEDPSWLAEARRALEWFLGGNDLGLEIYDAKSGGCRDGLQEDRINQNQGAESTLAFLLSLAEMKLIESVLSHQRQVQST